MTTRVYPEKVIAALKLTAKQERALRFIATSPEDPRGGGKSPADIGVAIWDAPPHRSINGATGEPVGLKAQGYGRLGGTMAQRLVNMGLIYQTHGPGGYSSGYRLTGHGQRWLEAHP